MQSSQSRDELKGTTTRGDKISQRQSQQNLCKLPLSGHSGYHSD